MIQRLSVNTTNFAMEEEKEVEDESSPEIQAPTRRNKRK
jgi:hypothetical protein